MSSCQVWYCGGGEQLSYKFEIRIALTKMGKSAYLDQAHRKPQSFTKAFVSHICKLLRLDFSGNFVYLLTQFSLQFRDIDRSLKSFHHRKAAE